MHYDIDDLIEAYKEWIDNEIEQCWTPYYVNIMFNHIPNFMGRRWEQMANLVENKFYVLLCNKLDRHPNRKGRHKHLPHVILFPDLPVIKRKKRPAWEISPNEGLHINGF